jgi:6-pyruvoyltetrahydropterin/6-carboxytetrahydropterin synthase
MIILKRHFSFCASHRLYNPQWSEEENKKIFGKCAGKNGHGHNYKLEVAITGDIDPHTGMIFHLQYLCDLVNNAVVNDLDHKHLNMDVPWLANKIPTTEILAVEIFKILDEKFKCKNKSKLCGVTVWETEKNIVTVHGS